MQRRWEAVRVVDEQQLQVLLEGQSPELAGLPAHYESEGWDNVCFLVDEIWIFRLPRRELGARLMQLENARLPLIAARSTSASYTPRSPPTRTRPFAKPTDRSPTRSGPPVASRRCTAP